MLKISPETVRKRVRAGDWECTQYSPRIWRFTRDQVDSILEGRPVLPERSPRQRSRLKDAISKIS